jgi:hypothetical protein
MSMNKHQVKGVIISIAFIVVGSVAGLYGVDLGRFFWIVLILLLLIGVILYPVWMAARSTRDKREPK